MVAENNNRKTNGTADEKAADEATENTARELKEEELNDVAGGTPAGIGYNLNRDREYQKR